MNIDITMFHSFIRFLMCFTCLRIISSENLNGIFVIDSCKCNSSSETCEPNGPFIFNQKRSIFAVRYGSQQVGVGSLEKDQLDLYVNQNRCTGLWNRTIHSAELKCQHQGGIICTTNFRCISGSCLDDLSTIISSASTTTLSFLLMIGILIMLV